MNRERFVLIYFLILGGLFSDNLFAQREFNYTDTVFYTGQVKPIDLSFYFSGGCFVTHKSSPVLDSLADFLEINDHLVIEVSCNTDFRGDSIINLKLSESRASRIKEYLLDKGIHPIRIFTNGNGENVPIIVSEKVNQKYLYLEVGQLLDTDFIMSLEHEEQREIAHQLNRRTDIKILRMLCGKRQTPHQGSKTLRACKVLGIDRYSLNPYYYVITIMEEDNEMTLLSQFEDSTFGGQEIKEGELYDFTVEALDSICIPVQDSIHCLKFGEIRGGDGTTVFYIDGKKVFCLNDFYTKPYRVINLKGLKYRKIELE